LAKVPPSSASQKRVGSIRIGISGWRYRPWRGTFYPAKLAQNRELSFASSHFNSIELNGSFYSLQRPESFQKWFDETPDNFQFSVKAPRFITHVRRLRQVETPLANFFAQGLLRLGAKLGPILWQFPPNFRFDEAQLEAFFQLLPHTHKQAAELAKKHDERMDGRSWLKVSKDRKLRHAIEIRNDSFVCDTFVQLLRKYRVGLVVADTVEWPRLMDVTTDFVYCRLHGSEQLYASGYSPQAIQEWAHRVRAWSSGQEVEDGVHASAIPARKRTSRDVFVYFDNDIKVRAPVDAQSLSDTIREATQSWMA
jgi:uncharacterized protein YecE (DUF72 family)